MLFIYSYQHSTAQALFFFFSFPSQLQCELMCCVRAVSCLFFRAVRCGSTQSYKICSDTSSSPAYWKAMRKSLNWSKRFVAWLTITMLWPQFDYWKWNNTDISFPVISFIYFCTFIGLMHLALYKMSFCPDLSCVTVCRCGWSCCLRPPSSMW